MHDLISFLYPVFLWCALVLPSELYSLHSQFSGCFSSLQHFSTHSLQVIEASSLEPSSVTPSVAGVPLSALEPVFNNLDDALEWCEEFFLLGQTTAAATAPLMLSPAEILEAAEKASSSTNEVVKSTPRPPAVTIPENGDEFSSDVSSMSNAPGSSTTGGFARHPSYYRTMQATRSPSGAKHPHVGDDAMMTMTSSSSSADALVAILEDYLQLPAASSPLRVTSAKTALAQHFKRSLVRTSPAIKYKYSHNYKTRKCALRVEIDAHALHLHTNALTLFRWHQRRCCFTAAAQRISSSFSRVAL